MEKEYITVGKIEKSKYNNLCKKTIKTDEVVITYKQIEHIEQKRVGIFNKYKERLRDIIENPDYIIKDRKHDETGLIIKKIEKNVIVVLKLNTNKRNRKNSIITIWEIKDKRLKRYLLTHKLIYKKE
ncbi:MAG: hypothetical protein E7311_01035 [Clostridiales bacterium]|nr:hypothetical protein [Clostridiales bacterium]